jgi:hypothetical protein
MARKSQYKKKLEYNNTYNRNNYRSFSVRFNNKTETDIIEWLEKKEFVKAYLTSLIKADMEAEEKKAAKKAAAKKTAEKAPAAKKSTRK